MKWNVIDFLFLIGLLGRLLSGKHANLSGIYLDINRKAIDSSYHSNYTLSFFWWFFQATIPMNTHNDEFKVDGSWSYDSGSILTHSAAPETEEKTGEYIIMIY